MHVESHHWHLRRSTEGPPRTKGRESVRRELVGFVRYLLTGRSQSAQVDRE
jgi:hypothetical protein